MKNKPSFKTLVRIFLFLCVFSFFLYIANLLVYRTLIVLFVITNFYVCIFLAIVLGALSASFVVATILGNRFYNLFTRVYYLASCIWVGFLMYAFLACFVYGILLTLTGVLFITLGKILLLIAFLASLYGIIHARHMVVKHVKIFLPNLPAAWRGKKAVWISDLHIGQIYDHRFTEKIVKKVNAIDHDIVFIGGDLYDGTQTPDILKSTLPLGRFNAPLGIYFITGNHEEFGDDTVFINAVKSAGIRSLINEVVNIDGLQIIGVDYRSVSGKAKFKKTLGELSFNPDKPSILLKHEPKNIRTAADAGISFQISGHTHKAQLWPLNFIGEIIYKRFAYGLHACKKMQVYTSSGIGTWGPPIRVGSNSEIVVFTFE